jgi:hypothetical protein
MERLSPPSLSPGSSHTESRPILLLARYISLLLWWFKPIWPNFHHPQLCVLFHGAILKMFAKVVESVFV